MADTNFVSKSLPAISTGWLNDVNSVVYRLLGTSAGSGGSAPTSRLAIRQSLGWTRLHATDYGFVGNGTSSTAGTDNQPFLTALFAAAAVAVANGGGVCIYIPQGIYDFNLAGTGDRILFSIGGLGMVRLEGDGKGITEVRFRAGQTLSQDCYFVRAASSPVSRLEVTGITFNGNNANNTFTGAQVHAISPLSCDYVDIDNCEFKNMRRDGIILIGASGYTSISNFLRVTNCDFISNGRSGITVQRGIRYVLIDGCFFDDTNDQHIDFEPTGTGSPQYLEIRRTIMKDCRGDTGLTLSGFGTGTTTPGDPPMTLLVDGLICIRSKVTCDSLRNAKISNSFIIGATSVPVSTWAVTAGAPGPGAVVTIQFTSTRAPTTPWVTSDTVEINGNNYVFTKTTTGNEIASLDGWYTITVIDTLNFTISVTLPANFSVFSTQLTEALGYVCTTNTSTAAALGFTNQCNDVTLDNVKIVALGAKMPALNCAPGAGATMNKFRLINCELESVVVTGGTINNPISSEFGNNTCRLRRNDGSTSSNGLNIVATNTDISNLDIHGNKAYNYYSGAAVRVALSSTNNGAHIEVNGNQAHDTQVAATMTAAVTFSVASGAFSDVYYDDANQFFRADGVAATNVTGQGALGTGFRTGVILRGSATLNPGNILANADHVGSVGTITVTGAVAGDQVISVELGDSSTANFAYVHAVGRVSANDTVLVSAHNYLDSAAVNLASATATCTVRTRRALSS